VINCNYYEVQQNAFVDILHLLRIIIIIIIIIIIYAMFWPFLGHHKGETNYKICMNR
jgi:hypothetical protein